MFNVHCYSFSGLSVQEPELKNEMTAITRKLLDPAGFFPVNTSFEIEAGCSSSLETNLIVY